MKKLVLFTLILTLLAACAARSEADIYVGRVENLPEDFIFGMDISSVLAEENSGVRYYGFDGSEADVFALLAENGVTHIRVRIWNDPYGKNGAGYGGGNCDIDAACEIGRRAAAHGLKLIAGFHYSDFWADPSKQMVPKAWQGMKTDAKAEALYEYTRESLLKLLNAGAQIDIVQIGNETNNYFCGEKKWFGIQALMQAGARAVREVCPEARVALHFTNPERDGALADYAWRMDYYKVDYDIFATSWYPYWHGSLENLSSVLSQIAEAYGKQVMVMETSYAYTTEDTDFFGNTIGEGASGGYPISVQGQSNLLRDLTDTIVNRTQNGLGVVYWEGAWISVGTSSWEENHALWEKYGSGWATSSAAEYDPDDAGRYYGGSAVDNQAFFDAQGRALESLRVFSLMKSGNIVPVTADAIEDSFLMCDINGEITLPESVNAVMNDNSRQALPVSWNAGSADINALRASGAGTYALTGTAGGMDAHLYLTLAEFNFIDDWSFEDGTGAWVLNDIAGADELYIEDKKSDSLTGTKHLHFWSARKNSVEFTAEQSVDSLAPGSYRYEISIMGGDAGACEVYAYVKINGETAAVSPMTITGYNDWHTGVIPLFTVNAGDSVSVGIYVKCSGEGNGAWGKIDDAKLNSVG